MADITMAQLASKLAIAAQRVDPEVERKMATLAAVAEGHVKTEIQAMHAVDTSTMLNSTTSEKVGPTTYLVGPNTIYAPYVALGTSRMAARPFHLTAARKIKADAREIFKGVDLGV